MDQTTCGSLDTASASGQTSSTLREKLALGIGSYFCQAIAQLGQRMPAGLHQRCLATSTEVFQR